MTFWPAMRNWKSNNGIGSCSQLRPMLITGSAITGWLKPHHNWHTLSGYSPWLAGPIIKAGDSANLTAMSLTACFWSVHRLSNQLQHILYKLPLTGPCHKGHKSLHWRLSRLSGERTKKVGDRKSIVAVYSSACLFSLCCHSVYAYTLISH